MKLFIKVTAKQIDAEGMSRINDDGTETQRFYIKPSQIIKAYRHCKKKFNPVKIRYSIDMGHIGTFFVFFGRQNDYLYPSSGEDAEHYPFPKAHWWKTRMGFTTAWEIAKSING